MCCILKIHAVCMINQKVTMGYMTPAVKYPTVVISAKEAVSQFVIPAKSCEVGCEPGSRTLCIYRISWIPDLSPLCYIRPERRIRRSATQPRRREPRKELDAPANQLPGQAYQACPRPDRESGMTVIGYLSPG